MKKLLRSAACPERARSVVVAMAFFLVLSSLLAPVMPVVDAATISNAQSAQHAAALQDDGSDPPPDIDADGIPDAEDSCPDVPNLGTDWNSNGIDDACDPQPIDTDMDGIPDDQDSCPDVPNLGTDWNNNGVDDACDPQPEDGMDEPDDTTDGVDGSTDDTMDEPMDQTPQDATLRIHVAWCPVEADLTTGEFGAEQLQNACTYQGPGVTVSLYDSGGMQASEQQAAMFPTSVTFAPLPQADWNIDVQTVPNIDEFFACEGYLYENGNQRSNTKPYASVLRSQTSTPMYPLTTIQDPPSNLEEHIDCYWFGQMKNHGIVVLNKVFCPQGTQPQDETYEYLDEHCQLSADADAEFRLDTQTSAPNYPQTVHLNPENNYQHTLYDVPPGGLIIDESFTAYYRLGGIYCQLTDWQNPNGTGEYVSQSQMGDSSFGVMTSAFSFQNCVLFNVALPGNADQPMDEVDDDPVDYGVSVTKYECHNMMPEGEMDSYGWYTTNCTTYQSGIMFRLAVFLGSPVSNGATDSNGYVSLYDGAPDMGEYLIDEMGLPEGYSAVAAFCRDVNAEGPMGEYMGYDITNNGVQVSFSGDHGKECLWFNYADPGVTQQQVTPSNLTIYKWICPVGYDYSMQGADPMMDCNTPAPDGITFTVSDTDPNTSNIQTSTGDQSPGNGYVYFGGFEPGMHTISESQLGGYDSAFLWNCEGYQNLVSQPINAGWSYDMDVPSGEEITCHWMNVPVEDEGYSVTLYKWLCPAGTMYGEMDSYYSAECDMEHNGVAFQYTDDNGTVDFTSDHNKQLDGLVGDVTITEVGLMGYGMPVAFCSEMNNGAQPSPMTVTNGSITLAASEYGYQCFWYNIPAEEYSVTLYKWQCPEDTMYGEMESYYSAECDMEHNDVPFQYTDDNGTTPFLSDHGQQLDGLSGQVTITELGLMGYGMPVVYCQLLNDNAGTLMTVTMRSVTLQPPMNDTWACNWYNIPLHDFSLTLYKWQCPQGTMYGEMESYYSAECNTQHPDVPFQITSDTGTMDFISDIDGYQVDGLRGQVILREMGLPGYGDPVVYCQLLNDQAPTLYTSTNGIVVLPPAMGDDYQCFWYNIPEPDSTVTINKYRCPDGMPAEYSQNWFEMNCGTPMDVDFTLIDNKGPRMMSTTNGMVQWTDVATGAIQITEHIPPGYAMQPYLVCVVTDPGGMPSAPFFPTTVNGTWHTTITAPGSTIECDWYNWYLGPGDITVHKRICPEGYNRHAWDADPMTDCTEMVNGITFKLDQPDPDVDLFSDTGDSMESAVFFGGLAPGDYILSEIVGPGEYQDIFTWQCYGLTMSSVHPTPLSVGQDLEIKIVGGDDIECYWFNVPYPQYGYMVVSKYNCSTEKWVSDVYCYTNQTGQYFDLQMWNGSTWSTVKSGTTDVSGKVTFDMLDAGEYRLIEPNKQACLMKSSNITSGGNLGVTTGEGTTVYVYNCKTPPPPQKTPTKYPNTGVTPSADSVRTPGVELAGLAGLLGMALNRRRVLAGAGVVTAGAAGSALPLLNAQELVPLDSTPAPGTPSPDVFWCATPTAGTPEAAGTPVVDPCNRGPIPIQMRIPIIEVDAPIEYLEIIDGLMQQPTGDTHIAWYKETSRLGEVGNGIYAAHVNWYGNPEGIFFRLESLKEGDVIEIDGDDLQTYLFEVQWMQDFPSDEEPPDEALGLTDEVAITLITCGGEWSSELSEYDHRTLVRAVLRE